MSERTSERIERIFIGTMAAVIAAAVMCIASAAYLSEGVARAAAEARLTGLEAR